MVRNTMETPAWRALPCAAKALYPVLKLEWHGPRANNNGRIRLSVRQAADALGVSPNTANKAFWALQEKGFLVVRSAGSLGAAGCGSGPEYEITELAMPNAQDGRKIYREWRPENELPVTRHATGNPSGRNGRES